jgi:flavin-dependent dehydrogenase
VARELTDAGLDVLVLDKARFPRDKVCAGWITPAVLDQLELDRDEYQEGGRVLQPIRGFRVGLEGAVGRRLSYDEVVSFAIRRCELDDFLLHRSGARLELGRALGSFEWRRGRWRVNGDIEAELLIGAGGHFCPVARRLGGALAPSESAVVAQEVEIELTGREAQLCAVEPEIPELYFADDLQGYGWCVRKGRFLNVGIGHLNRAGFASRARAFMAGLQRLGRIPRRAWSLRGHAYLVRNRSPRPVFAEGALLVGDAAGLAYPTSGEGIRPAVESALLAAQAVWACAGDFRASRLEHYERRLTHRFGPAAAADREPPKLAPWKRAAARRIVETPWLARHLLIDRWFLRRHVPPLERSGALQAPESRDLAA